jgi:SHS2 domain-containing protein
LEHTADLGLCLTAPDAPALFAVAARALFDQIAAEPRPGAGIRRTLRASGSDWSDLLVDWLRELLYLWNGERLLLRRVKIVDLTTTALRADLELVAFDPAAHEILQEIKAVTYHRAQVNQSPAGWEATVILDV